MNSNTPPAARPRVSSLTRFNLIFTTDTQRCTKRESPPIMLNGTFCTADTKALAKRERDPICDVCGHNHVQGVKCDICGHVGKYIGATQPAGAPVTTDLAASNLTAACLCLACRQFLVDPIDRTVALSRRCLRAPCMRRISHHPQLKGSRFKTSSRHCKPSLSSLRTRRSLRSCLLSCEISTSSRSCSTRCPTTIPRTNSPLMCLPYHAALS